MACRLSITEEDLYCPICCDIFRDPVLLACSHSICNGCVKTFWNRRGTQECPICRIVSSKPILDPPINIVLRNMCDLIREETTQDLPVETTGFCRLHGELLTFFCAEDQELVCGKCRNALHKNHRIRSTTDASQDLRYELQQKLKAFLEKLGVYERFKQSWDETAEYIKRQSQHTETQIKEAFEKLHQFLENEEAASLTALRREDKQKSEIIKKKIEEITSGMLSLSHIIESIEDQLRRNDFTFLVNYKTAIERTKCTLRDQTRPSGMLIDVAKHVGNITYVVSKKLQANIRYTPVTLDPNTAHPYLTVSDDLTTITYTDEHFQQLPANPERFDGYTSILGSEGFDSGSHCWDIEVGDSTAWAVGVITESAYKLRQNPSKTGLWYVGFCNGKYGKGYSPEILTLLRVSQRIQRIRVQLDWDKGKVIFTDSGHNIGLHVFKHAFTEKVFPYFYNHCMQHPLRIIPVKKTVEAHI
ncbi:E3 ubiquitin-protein ligase TRIM35-like [Rhinichthys klamathensis goyatoka]|uniref:E3 ubiquitin-protein ligase TRIM35-like n=1 Tax=Rhinichthys klamathensis goyatoka TaxID=3034132 RepID=UPI0024B50F6F|nr:E3 ubiquitin-protein ligase TRIM35-like [Rhinichthys klamathensis goyatoka]